MKGRVLLTLAAFAFLSLGSAVAEERAKRPEWDQKKAIEKAKKFLALEATGKTPWNDIPWHTDPVKVAALAQKEQKPIFIYFFLKGNVGPAHAPC